MAKTRSELREKIMTILYQINLFKNILSNLSDGFSEIFIFLKDFSYEKLERKNSIKKRISIKKKDLSFKRTNYNKINIQKWTKN